MEPKLVTRRQDRQILEELKRREPVFHRPEFSTPRELEKLVARDFWEIGASGRRYSRRYVLQTLAARTAAAPADEWQTSDAHCRALAPGLYLFTYTLRQGGASRAAPRCGGASARSGESSFIRARSSRSGSDGWRSSIAAIFSSQPAA